MQSTYVTWTKVCKYHKIPESSWKLNGQYNYIEFTNGSRIDLVDLKYLPSDPLYERFGSLEYTDGAIEEAGEVNYLAYDTLKSRVGRHRNEEFKVNPTMLITGNPKKNWTYIEFYKKYKKNKLPKGVKFIQALYKDNPYTAKSYEQQLSSITDKVNKQRLMFGNWEYEDDETCLMSYQNITDLFTNPVIAGEDKYIVADIARYGRDKTVISIWSGMVLKEFIVKIKQGVDQTAETIRTLMWDYNIPYSHCLIDDDGVGGGVVDILRGVNGFVNNSAPILNNTTGEKENYQNLKTQCAYTLAEAVKNHEIRIECQDEQIKSDLIEELEQIKMKDIDDDNKKKIIPKDEVKEIIGRSPDFSDNLLMRMWFSLSGASGIGVKIIRSNFKSRL